MRGCGQKRQAVEEKWKASGDKERKRVGRESCGNREGVTLERHGAELTGAK